MKKLFSLIMVLGLLFGEIAVANQTILMCGGKYIGYDDQFIYINWEEYNKNFRDKLKIIDKQDTILVTKLSTSDTLVLFTKKKYLSYWLYGKERIGYLCKKI